MYVLNIVLSLIGSLVLLWLIAELIGLIWWVFSGYFFLLSTPNEQLQAMYTDRFEFYWWAMVLFPFFAVAGIVLLGWGLKKLFRSNLFRRLKDKLKRYSNQLTMLLTFLILFGGFEIYLRASGAAPGMLGEDIIHDKMDLRQLTWSDEMGINRYYPDAPFHLLNYSAKINQDGFRSDFEYDAATIAELRKGKELVLVIGDSHTEGCCPKDGNSFVRLLDQNPRFMAVNLGISGTGPLQYELVASHYVPALQPDKVLVVLCAENDSMEIDQVPTPGIPQTYQTKFGFVYSQKPVIDGYGPNEYFASGQEAQDYMYRKHTILGKDEPLLAKMASGLSVTTFIYKIIFHKIKDPHPLPTVDASITTGHLNNITKICEAHGITTVFAAVPIINDVDHGVTNLGEKYRRKFPGIPLNVPEDLVFEDYVGYHNHHLNKNGHQKFAVFLEGLLNAQQSP